MVRFFCEPKTASFLSKLEGFLSPQGIECYLVGGFVRDGLLGQVTGDIDLAVSTEAMSIATDVAAAFGGRFVLLDEINKVARVVFPDEGWHLDICTMRGDIQEDLAHRDFTINAIAISLNQIKGGWSQVELIDPLAGFQDIEQKAIRVVSDSAFPEDPARLLRAVRLEAELDFTIDSDTEAAIKRHCHLITSISGERVHDELYHILTTPRAASSLRHLDQLGLLTSIIPELIPAKGATQPKEHFWDVFEHSLEIVAAVEQLLESPPQGLNWTPMLAAHFEQEATPGRSRKALLKLAALLHDVAKPHTKTVEDNGRIRFLGHAKQGAESAVSIMERLRFSTKEIRMVSKMVEYHLRPGQLSNAEEMPTHRAIYRYFRDAGDVGIDTLFLSLADHLATRGPLLDSEEWHSHVQKTQYVITQWFEEQATVKPPKLIDGHDLIDSFGMSPGPDIGRILEAVREAQAAGEITTTEQALAFVERELKEV
jgi:poly(A) polymerase